MARSLKNTYTDRKIALFNKKGFIKDVFAPEHLIPDKLREICKYKTITYVIIDDFNRFTIKAATQKIKPKPKKRRKKVNNCTIFY